MHISSKLALLAALCALGTAAAVAPALSPVPAAEDPAILRIRAHFTLIEREAPTYRCRTVDLDGFSAEGGSVEACYAGPELRRLSASYLGESGRSFETFYFWGDSLEFLYGKHERYDRPLSGNVRATEEERLYWNNGQLIRWQNGKTRQKVTTPAARKRSEDERATARQLAACAANMADSTCEA